MSNGDELGPMSVIDTTVNGGGGPSADVGASAGSAVTSPDALDIAAMTTSPLPAFSVPASDAVVTMFSMSMATEPATPTLPAPAPDAADAPSSWVEPTPAWMVAPSEVTVVPTGRMASLRIRA